MNFQIAQRCISASAGQDRVFLRVFDDLIVVAIADGAGGQAGGSEAAQIVVNEAARVAQTVHEPHDSQFWATWLGEIDDLISSDNFAGQSTAIIAAIGDDFVAGASVGDSSAWLVGADGWRDLTERQRKPFLGVGAAVPAPFSARIADQTLLLATDGLTRYADHEMLVRIARSGQIEVAADELVAAVRYPSGNFPDDVSVVLCRLIREKAPKNANRKSSLWQRLSARFST